MIKILNKSEIPLDEILKRDFISTAKADAEVAKIIENIRKNGDSALKKYTLEFDHVDLDSFEITEKEIKSAYDRTDKKLIGVMERAIYNIRDYHSYQKKNDYIINKNDGIILGQKITPVDRAGIYVPGGTASYPSSLIMNAVPAQIAGVAELIMVSPPTCNGTISDVILAAAYLLKLNRIFKVGGPFAIAALAFGTESIPKADKIVGPGNLYVASAKKQVFGVVDIDMIAGPSEILIISDEFTSPELLAADLLSQAEHDVNATSILITTDKNLAKAASDEIEKQLNLLSRKDIARKSIDNNGKIIIVNSITEAIEISNMIAPEHLELCTDDPFDYLSLIKHAGSIFLGRNTPEPLGDYYSGTNHILPTNGTAKFSSPLSVDDFTKKSSFTYYTNQALNRAADDTITFAGSEGLDAHAESIKKRMK